MGLLFVGDGQEDQREVLRNDSKATSPLYREFVGALGWPVDLDKHKGYAGGLYHNNDGTDALYFGSPLVEVVYHEVVRMPTAENDPQQLKKKRHVGNDTVHIVWSEHGRDYSPKMITSQFNDAHIIVYPLPNGLFRVQIAKKDKVQPFGPLVHGMAVPKRLLPLLVRQSAMNAYRGIRSNTEGYEKP